jgi:hypothetical protein
MSACLFMYGVRFDIPREERPLLESHEHPLIKRSREAGLGSVWADVEDHLYLFVGRKLASIGVDGDLAARYHEDELKAMAEEVEAKLKAADLQGDPSFWLRWIP